MNKTKMVWAFDLGKGSIGEAVRRGTEFLHKASLLIPADFAETKTAASRRRMWRTRQAHKAREQWLDEVMLKAGIEPLKGRQIGKLDENGKPIPQPEWKRRKGKWGIAAKGDPRLEREFAEPGDPTCYTSCLLRIKLLRGEKLEPWQVYKALHSAIQRRGYAVLSALCHRSLLVHGLLPQLGVHHKPRYRSDPLVYDLMEPFRPAVELMLAEFMTEPDVSMKAWSKKVGTDLRDRRVTHGTYTLKLMDAIDASANSLARAYAAQSASDFWVPELPQAVAVA